MFKMVASKDVVYLARDIDTRDDQTLVKSTNEEVPSAGDDNMYE